jgi:hypothetical protein
MRTARAQMRFSGPRDSMPDPSKDHSVTKRVVHCWPNLDSWTVFGRLPLAFLDEGDNSNFQAM